MRYSQFNVVTLLFLMVLYCSQCFAFSVKNIQSKTYKVTVKDKSLRNKIYISFHNELVKSEKDVLYLSINESQKNTLKKKGLQLTPVEYKKLFKTSKQSLISNNTGTIPGFSCYPTVEETFDTAYQLAIDNPTLAQWIDIGDSWEKTTSNLGYDIKVLKITNQKITKDKPVLFIQSAMHAREYSTAALTLDFAKSILFNYSRKADVKWIVDNHEIHILFHLNPDGRKQAEKGISWRKNTNTNYCSPTSGNRGADLNRNFTFTWGQSNTGSSSNQCDFNYRGTAPASEPEVAAVESYIRSIFVDRRGEGLNDASPIDIQGIHLDIHSYSELILWPWGHTENPAPNANELERLGRRLAYWNNYTPMQSIGLYPTDGTSESVSYGELGIPEFTFELGTSFFEPCDNYLNQIKPDNLPALFYAAKSVSAPFKLPFGPDILDLRLNSNVNLNIQQGDMISISGTIEDGLYNAVGAILDTSNIKNVSIYIDTPPWEDGAQPVFANAEDGTFDSAKENFSLDLGTNNWSDGEHILYVQGENEHSQKGVVSSAFVVVGEHSNSEVNIQIEVDCTQAICQFDSQNSSDDGFIVNYHWDFGDNTVNDENKSKVTKSYATENTFQVELKVTDDYGLVTSKTETIEISAKPTSKFNIDCDFLSCTFNAQESSDLSGDIVEYQWMFNDGSQFSGEIVNRVFTEGGSYTVTLTTIDDESDNDSLVKTFSVAKEVEPPVNQSGGGGINIYGILWFIMIYQSKVTFKYNKGI